MCHTAGFECRNKSTDLILKRLVKLVLIVKEIIDQFWLKKKDFDAWTLTKFWWIIWGRVSIWRKKLRTVGIWITNYSGVQKVEKRLDAKWSCFRIPFEYRTSKPNHTLWWILVILNFHVKKMNYLPICLTLCTNLPFNGLDLIQPWWLGSLEGVSNSSRYSLAIGGLNPA